jgi:hypothetical protein
MWNGVSRSEVAQGVRPVCIWCVSFQGNMREGIDLDLLQAADIESHNKNSSSSSQTLPQLKALICAYPMTNPDDHPAQPKAAWAEKAAKMFPGDWEYIRDYPVKGKVCTGYAFPIGRYVKQVGSAFALSDLCDRFDTCRDPRLLFAKSASHKEWSSIWSLHADVAFAIRPPQPRP